MPKLSIKIGDGFEFDSDNSITSSWATQSIDGEDIKQPDGLYVPSLKGRDGSEGTVVDNHTLIEDGSGVSINPKVVQLIYQMNVWKLQLDDRAITFIPYLITNGKKVKRDKTSVLSEINFIFNKKDSDPCTPYPLKENDLFMFIKDGDVTDTSGKTGYIHTFVNKAGTVMESPERHVYRTAVALFVVESVTPKPEGFEGELSDIALRCLWSEDGFYTKGELLDD